MSTQVPVYVTTTPIVSQTPSQTDFETAAGYRELAAQAAANGATHRAQAGRFAAQGQNELSHVCHQLAQEAISRSEGYAAHADFFEKPSVEVNHSPQEIKTNDKRPRRKVVYT